MIADQLEPRDCEILRRCLEAAADGPFFELWEFHTLMGVHLEQVQEVLARWPRVDLSEEKVLTAVNNTLVNLLYYPHGEDFEAYVGATAADLERLLRWLRSGGLT